MAIPQSEIGSCCARMMLLRLLGLKLASEPSRLADHPRRLRPDQPDLPRSGHWLLSPVQLCVFRALDRPIPRSRLPADDGSVDTGIFGYDPGFGTVRSELLCAPGLMTYAGPDLLVRRTHGPCPIVADTSGAA